MISPLDGQGREVAVAISTDAVAAVQDPKVPHPALRLDANRALLLRLVVGQQRSLEATHQFLHPNHVAVYLRARVQYMREQARMNEKACAGAWNAPSTP